MNTSIQSRDDLSFTQRDRQGRMINWPRNNPGVSADRKKGIAFFNEEISGLALNNETEAFDAIRFAIVGMGGHYTNLELSFAEQIARAVTLGLRYIRNGAAQFEPKETLKKLSKSGEMSSIT